MTILTPTAASRFALLAVLACGLAVSPPMASRAEAKDDGAAIALGVAAAVFLGAAIAASADDRKPERPSGHHRHEVTPRHPGLSHQHRDDRHDGRLALRVGPSHESRHDALRRAEERRREEARRREAERRHAEAHRREEEARRRAQERRADRHEGRYESRYEGRNDDRRGGFQRDGRDHDRSGGLLRGGGDRVVQAWDPRRKAWVEVPAHGRFN